MKSDKLDSTLKKLEKTRDIGNSSLIQQRLANILTMVGGASFMGGTIYGSKIISVPGFVVLGAGLILNEYTSRKASKSIWELSSAANDISIKYHHLKYEK